MSEEKPIKIIKPFLISWVVLVKHLPFIVNISFVGGGVITALSLLSQFIFGTNFPLLETFIYAGCTLLILSSLMIYFIFSKTYQLTEYRFYREHLEYAEGFWTVVYKQILYRNITEISLRKTMVQRLYGLGSLYLAVPSATRGIYLADLKEPEKVYKQIQDIVRGAVNQ